MADQHNENVQKVTAEQLRDDLMPRKFKRLSRWIGIFFAIIAAIGLFAYIKQLRFGLGVTGMGDYVSWGLYISNFVFFVAVSLVGSLITAILYLLDVKWRSPLTRLSEVIAVACIIFAAVIIIVDMGRPDRMLNLVVHGRIQSPIIWDVIVIGTYMVISLLLLYFPMLPGLALCRDHLTNVPKWQRRMYKMLALGWKGTDGQIKIQKRSIRILAILIIPVALSIHTVTSWLFATTVRPGWDSTNFGPYFVSGAFMAGAAAVIIGMYLLFRIHPHIKKYITDKHFDRMGRLLVLLTLIYLYFNVNEYLVPAYKMKGVEAEHLMQLFTGSFAPMFWSVIILGMIVPVIALLFKKGRKPGPLFIISVLVIVGAWFKRYLIVIPTMLHPYLSIQEGPERWSYYAPTWEEWFITLGSLAGAALIIMALFRFFPAVSISEVAEEHGVDLKTLNGTS